MSLIVMTTGKYMRTEILGVGEIIRLNLPGSLGSFRSMQNPYMLTWRFCNPSWLRLSYRHPTFQGVSQRTERLESDVK